MSSERAISLDAPHQVVTADVASAERTHTLRHDDCFGLFNEIGDIDAEARTEAGLYRAGVRHLSRLTLTVAGLRPLLLAASPREDNVLLSVNLTNPDVRGEGGRIVLPRGTLHITRTRFIWAGVCHEMIKVRNFALTTVAVELVIRFGSDFEHIIDVRAQRRVDAGRARFERVERDSVTQGYLGADELVRETVVDCHTAPDAISSDALRYRLQIGSRGEKTIALAIGCRSANQPVQITTYTRSLAAAEELARNESRPPCQVESSDATFNAWLQRSAADIGMMLTATPHGRVPAAGLPWLDALFGRDAVIVALQTLWLWPDIARNVLRYLAATQSSDTFAANGAEPGKILNEARGGDIAPNYFGVDTTPLFVHAGRCLLRAHRGPRLHRGVVAGRLPGAVLDRRVRRRRRRRFRRGALAHRRADAAWLEELAGFGIPRRRTAGAGAAGLVRGAGLRLRRQARRRPDRQVAGRDAARHRAGRGGAGPAGAFQQRLLVLGHRVLRAGAGRRQAALPRAHLEPRALPVHRHRPCGARPPVDRGIRRRADVLGLGRAHRGGERIALQPDVVSQRCDLAA